MKKKKLLPVAALAAAAVLLLGLWYFARPQVRAGEKSIVVEVVHGDQSVKEFTYRTEAEYLGETLLSEGLIQGEKGAYGLYITTVDGEEADAGQNQWWCLTRDGQQVNTGVDTTPVADGDHFELTLSLF